MAHTGTLEYITDAQVNRCQLGKSIFTQLFLLNLDAVGERSTMFAEIQESPQWLIINLMTVLALNGQTSTLLLLY